VLNERERLEEMVGRGEDIEVRRPEDEQSSDFLMNSFSSKRRRNCGISADVK
jgi:hypothetical protein